MPGLIQDAAPAITRPVCVPLQQAERIPSHRQQPTSTADDDLLALEQFVATHGHQPDSYLATQPGRELFWSTGDEGLVSFARRGRHVLVSGGLIAPPGERRQLLQEFLELLAPRKLRPMFFCVPDEDLPLFREVGFQITKLGEDALVDLADLTFSGKEYQWVRRQVNYCRRQGLVASELQPDACDPETWNDTLDEALEVCRELMKHRPQTRELEFFDGQIGEHRVGQRRVFVARSDDGLGRIEGFVVCNPMLGGRKWALEIYRHRPDAVRGTLPFLFHHILTQMREEGVEAANLSILLGHNCQEPMPNDNPFVRKGFARAEKYFSLLFDVTGIAHFKSRFRPRYENCYYCSPPDPSFGGFWAVLMQLGVLRIAPLKTLRLAVHRVRKRTRRQSLPRLHPEAVR